MKRLRNIRGYAKISDDGQQTYLRSVSTLKGAASVRAPFAGRNLSSGKYEKDEKAAGADRR